MSLPKLPPARSLWASSLALLLSALMSACGDSPSGNASSSGTRAGSVEEYLAEMEADGFNGVVAIDHAGEVTIRAFGMADRDAGVANAQDTVFDIGSITKQFTGAAILRLEMDDLLSVDDVASDYIEGLPEELAEVTLHQLLTHSAGLHGGVGGDYDPVNRDEMLAIIGREGLLFEPGERFEYSNPGYSLLGMVVEEVSGMSYDDYLATALFEPAGMTDTGYLVPEWEPERVAVGYAGDDPENRGKPNELPWADDGPYWHLRANGGVLSTAADMLQWSRAMQGDDVLDAAAREKLFGRHIEQGPDTDTYYGYGWTSFPTSWDGWAINHNGGNGIFGADLWMLPDRDLTVFIATNNFQPWLVVASPTVKLASRTLGEPVLPASLMPDS